MQTRTRVGAALLAAITALSLTSCRSSGTGGDATTGAGAGATTGGTSSTANTSPIPVASILDETGATSGYGLPMQNATKLAIADINANGGVLGRQLQLTDLDSQSDQAKYVVEARQVADSDAAVVMGGILSASREAIRPVFDQAKKLYFYAPLYEGGVCDKDMFSTGDVPYQQLAPLLKWAADQGMKKWYVMAANYNYGQISASWVKQFAKDDGATLVGGSPKFYDLTVSDFSNAIGKVQASGADLIVSLLVGAAQENFYKQWTATGLNKSTKIVSPTYGFGAEQVALGKAGAGIYAAWPYMPTANPSASDAFAAAWKASGTKDPITPGAVSTWNAWHLWAAGANKAGSVDRDKVIAALESGGVTYDSPAGPISFDGPTHQAVLPMKLWQDTGKGSFELVTTLSTKSEPVFLQSKCNLIKDPTLNKQFTP